MQTLSEFKVLAKLGKTVEKVESITTKVTSLRDNQLVIGRLRSQKDQDAGKI